MVDVMIIIQQMIKFFIMILMGIICVKTGILEEKNLNVISKLIMRMILPVFIFSNTIAGTTRATILEDAILIPLTVLIYAIWISFALVLGKMSGLKGDREKVYRALFTFGNVGFMGIPLITAVFPEKGMLYIALFTIVDQMILWTYGVFLTEGGNSGFSLKGLKKMMNPALAAILLSIVFVLLEIPLPDVVKDALKTVGNASTPMSLIFIGGSLAFCDLKELLRNREIYIGMIGKMLILPIPVFLLLYHVLHLQDTIAVTMTLLTALPCMTTIPMMAKTNGTEGDYAVSVCMLSQLFCLLTMPLVSAVISVLS